MESKTMKHISIFLLLLMAFLMTMPLQAQTINQQGVTYRYNGKNKRTPIGGVYIKAITANNGEVSDEQTGAFTLALNNLKMGSRIGNVRVTKQGMMVFNQQAVDEWSVRKDPLCLILCNADEFQKQKKNLIAIGESQAKKKYDKKLEELKKQNDAKQLKIDEYYNKLDSLEKEYQNALKHMDEYADVFARIDESEVDTVAQRAIEMFNRGEIEESIHLLEQQNYMEKIKQANRTIEQADAMISTAEQAKTLAEQDKEKYIEGIKTQIAGYKLQNEWDKAKELLKGLADNLNTLDAIRDYALFCSKQNDLIEAEAYFLKYEAKVRKSIELSESEKQINVAKAQNNLGNLYLKTQRFSESEELYKSALAIRERLAEANPQAYEPDLAAFYNNLATLYCKTKRFAEGEAMYKSALAIRERLAEANPQAYEAHLAQSYHSLGNLYYENQRFSESEAMYKSALGIYERLAKANPQAYEPVLAVSYHNLASLFVDTNRFSESEEMYKSAIAISERLAKDNPQVYEPDLATSYNNLASLYYKTQRFSESEEMYKSAIAIRERLTEANPQAYEPVLAQSYYDLANLYCKTKCFAESEAMYKSALGIYERLAKSNPQAYEPHLAQLYYNLGLLYHFTHHFAESVEMYNSALTIYESIREYTSAFDAYLAMVQNNLAALYKLEERYSESEMMYKKCTETYLCLYNKSPLVFEENLAKSYLHLGEVLKDQHKYDEAIEPFQKSLAIGRQIMKAGKGTEMFRESISNLVRLLSMKKDYISAYSYNEELIVILKDLYENDTAYEFEYARKLSDQSFLSNLLGDFERGEKYAEESLKVYGLKFVISNIAAAYLFQGKVEEAEKIYCQYKADLKDDFLSDFAEYERLGVIPEERKKDVERIKAMLNEE